MASSHMLTPKPCDPEQCQSCMIGQAHRIRQLAGRSTRGPQQFGDLLTCDHAPMKGRLGVVGVGGAVLLFHVEDVATN
eukprot:7203051-Lingulodinium_polyedra.AAC.1